MSELERLQAEKGDLEKKLLEQENARTTAERRAALAGKVSDLDYALYKIGQNEDAYVKDGNLDLEKFLKDHPQPGRPTPSRSQARPAPHHRRRRQYAQGRHERRDPQSSGARLDTRKR